MEEPNSYRAKIQLTRVGLYSEGVYLCHIVSYQILWWTVSTHINVMHIRITKFKTSRYVQGSIGVDGNSVYIRYWGEINKPKITCIRHVHRACDGHKKYRWLIQYILTSQLKLTGSHTNRTAPATTVHRWVWGGQAQRKWQHKKGNIVVGHAWPAWNGMNVGEISQLSHYQKGNTFTYT